MKYAQTVEAHIKSLKQPANEMVESIRNLVRELVPDAVECIKYGIPTFTLHGKNLVHFAGYKNHIGFYPSPSGIESFKNELEPYIKGKGTIQFSLYEPLPMPLIRKIILFRVNETLRARSVK